MNLVIQLFLYKINHNASKEECYLKKRRQYEIDFCFLTNINHPTINKVYVLCDTQEAIDYYRNISGENYNKVTFVLIGHQPTYKEFLEFISQVIPPNEYVCIMNSDIYFHSSFSMNIIEKHLKPNVIFGITRHEHTDTNHINCNSHTCDLVYLHRGSYDTFIFKTPISKDIDLNSINNRQNIYGSENIFLHAWYKAKYTILNPCHQIITIHLHTNRIYFEKYNRINVGREYFCDKEECPEDSNTLIKLPDILEEG